MMWQAWSEDKQAAFHEALCGQQTDVTQYSKFHWRPMKGRNSGTLQVRGGDSVLNTLKFNEVRVCNNM